jgi:arsenite methyltransferase
MVEQTASEIREAVKANYGARAREVMAGKADGCCGDSPANGVKEQHYAGEPIEDMPESVVSYGCGNPLAIAGLELGEVVLDLGSGAGLDCFLAAQRVGREGRAIGLDMTDEMLALAAQNKAKLGATNVEFRKGVMEDLPIDDASVDVIISNCVINLSPDKDAVFREAFRVLRPGGRLQVSDVVLLCELSAVEQKDMKLWSGCVAGALERADYAGRLAEAGFVDVSVEPQDASEGSNARAWRSAQITGYKPGGEPRRVAGWQGERLELVAPAGLQQAACCGDGCCSAATEAVELVAPAKPQQAACCDEDCCDAEHDRPATGA